MKNNLTIKEHITELDKKVEKRPTFMQIITISGIGLTVAIALFTFISTFLLRNQSSKIAAETKLIVTESINNYSEDENLKWYDRKDNIISEVLAYINNKFNKN